MNDIEKKLNNAINAMPKADFDYIVNMPVHKMEKNDEITKTNLINMMWFKNTAAVLIMICVLYTGGWSYYNILPYSYINLDINPSIELTVNRRDTVIGIKGINDDGKEILGNVRRYKGSVENGIELIMNVLEENEYLSKDKNTILVTVNAKNKEKSEIILSKVDSKISEYAVSHNIDVNLVAQCDEISKAERKESKKLNISAGKLKLINKAEETKTDTDKKVLKNMSVEELLEMVDIDVEKQNVNNSSVKEDKEYNTAKDEKERYNNLQKADGEMINRIPSKSIDDGRMKIDKVKNVESEEGNNTVTIYTFNNESELDTGVSTQQDSIKETEDITNVITKEQNVTVDNTVTEGTTAIMVDTTTEATTTEITTVYSSGSGDNKEVSSVNTTTVDNVNEVSTYIDTTMVVTEITSENTTQSIMISTDVADKKNEDKTTDGDKNSHKNDEDDKDKNEDKKDKVDDEKDRDKNNKDDVKDDDKENRDNDKKDKDDKDDKDDDDDDDNKNKDDDKKDKEDYDRDNYKNNKDDGDEDDEDDEEDDDDDEDYEKDKDENERDDEKHNGNRPYRKNEDNDIDNNHEEIGEKRREQEDEFSTEEQDDKKYK